MTILPRAIEISMTTPHAANNGTRLKFGRDTQIHRPKININDLSKICVEDSDGERVVAALHNEKYRGQSNAERRCERRTGK